MAERISRADARRYRLMLTVTSGTLIVTFAVGSGLQASLLQLAGDAVDTTAIGIVPARILANLIAAGTSLTVLAFTPIIDRSALVKLSWVLLAGAVGLLVRAAALIGLGVHSIDRIDQLLIDMPAAAIAGIIGVGIGMAAADADRRRILDERRGSRRAATAAHALGQLRTSQLKGLAREAQRAHTTLSEHLDRIEGMVLDSRSDVDGRARLHLDAIAAELSALQVRDLAAYRRMLDPDGVDVGLAPALRIMIGRIPSEIAVEADLRRSLVDADDPAISPVPMTVRSLAVRVLAMAITTALERYRVTAFKISARVERLEILRMVIEDDGDRRWPLESVPEYAAFRDQLAAVGGELELANERSSLGGARLDVRIDLTAAVPEGDWS